MGRIVILIEDKYGSKALEVLLKRIVKESKGSVNALLTRLSKIDKPYPLKFRLIDKYLRDKDVEKLIVIVDSETKRSDERRRQILKWVHVNEEKLYVIINKPCLEAWICNALGLKNCRIAPCDMGPLKSVKEYWRRKYRDDYDKSLIHRALMEAPLGDILKVKEVGEFLEAIKDP